MAPVITLLTDFGSSDPFAGIMKGVILAICPHARIVDLTHEVPPQDVRTGALLLRGAAAYFPAGTIHIAVVDPGVGSRRRAVLVDASGAWFIGPDNGLLQPAAAARGIGAVHELNRAEYHLPDVGRTFHGRDVFAPVAAHLAAGVAPAALGPVVEGLEALALPEAAVEGDALVGEVVHLDRFGNLVTSIRAADLARFRGSELSVSIAGCASIPLRSAYAEGARGAPLAVIGSWDHLEIAVRDGDAARTLGAGRGTVVRVVSR